MSGPWSVYTLMGISPAFHVARLREALDDGLPPDEVLAEAAQLGLHPLSIAAAPPPSLVGWRYLWRQSWEIWLFGWQDQAVDPEDRPAGFQMRHSFYSERLHRAANCEAARRLGIENRWIPHIQGWGLRIRDPRIQELPDGLALNCLHLAGLKNLRELPPNLSLTTLRLEQCHQVQQLPRILDLQNLHVLDCQGLTELSTRMDLDCLHLAACPSLRRLPSLKARVLKLANCPMVSLPEGMNLKRISLKRMPLLSALPKDMEEQSWWSNSCLSRGDWNIESCPVLKHLPWETQTTTALGLAFSKAGLAGQA